MGLCLACLPAVVLLKKNAPEQALLLTAAILSPGAPPVPVPGGSPAGNLGQPF